MEFFLFRRLVITFRELRLTKYMNKTKVMKGVSGATHFLNRIDDSALSRWELSGPDFAKLITEFENQVDRQ